ncbi:ethanolamine utilization protein EutH [Litoribacterium kuwaitense]|uniref:ethanolamine utilization protein EutH n=1 Tax=Litoribacterium kuwaitense TaxID=1398745 RepID=UPI001FEB841B|nr:ethanolamine utilization protein EutH [Litoribacterium kuwaitense]
MYEWIIGVITVGMVLGVIDAIRGHKWGIGQAFEKGFHAMGPLALSMIGMISLAPVIASILRPIVTPVLTAVGVDPSIFATVFLAIDMGGYSLAEELALSRDAALFSGVLLGTMLGPTLTFTIPVALGLIAKEDRSFFSLGVLCGLITIPLGLIVGGLSAGFSLVFIVLNTWPVMVGSLFLGLGLWRWPERILQWFQWFSKGVTIVILIGLAAVIVETLLGWVVIPGLTPFSESAVIVGRIAIVLAGAFPLVWMLEKALYRWNKGSEQWRTGLLGVITSMAHAIPMFQFTKKMSPRGKVVNFAFCVSGAFVLGGHLGYTATVASEMVGPMVIGKLAAGVTAIVLAFYWPMAASVKH